MSALFRLFSVFPLWLLHGLGAAVGWLVFVASSVYRQRLLANAAQAGYGFTDVRPAIAHAGRMAAELPRLWLGRPLPCAIEGAACVDQAYAVGRGVVFLTPHLGCFEIAAQAIAQQWSAQRGPITVLYRPARKAWLASIMETSRSRPGMAAVPTNLQGVRHMIKALRRGEAVGLLPDQVPPEGQGLWAPFFGRDAYTMTLAARLVQQTGATVVLVRAERLSWGRGFVAHFEPLPLALSDELATATAQINQAMEGLIRQCPQQYLWGYARYKHPRADTQAGVAA